MKPIEFDQMTKKVSPRSRETKYNSLPIHNDGKQCISCWQLSLWEQIKLIWTGEIWLQVCRKIQPPVCVTVGNPFKKR